MPQLYDNLGRPMTWEQAKACAEAWYEARAERSRAILALELDRGRRRGLVIRNDAWLRRSKGQRRRRA